MPMATDSLLLKQRQSHSPWPGMHANRAGGQHLDDVRVVAPREGADLLPEARHEIGVRKEVLVDGHGQSQVVQ